MDYLKTQFSILKKTYECPKSLLKKHTWRSICLFQIQVHGNDWTSFYEQVPKEVLPTDYGGKAGSVAEYWGETEDNIKPEMVHFLQAHFNPYNKCTSNYY